MKCLKKVCLNICPLSQSLSPRSWSVCVWNLPARQSRNPHRQRPWWYKRLRKIKSTVEAQTICTGDSLCFCCKITWARCCKARCSSHWTGPRRPSAWSRWTLPCCWCPCWFWGGFSDKVLRGECLDTKWHSRGGECLCQPAPPSPPSSSPLSCPDTKAGVGWDDIDGIFAVFRKLLGKNVFLYLDVNFFRKI